MIKSTYTIFLLLTFFIIANGFQSCDGGVKQCYQCQDINNTKCEPGQCVVRDGGDPPGQERLDTETCPCPQYYVDDVDESKSEIVGCKLDCKRQCGTCTLQMVIDGTEVCESCADPSMLLPSCLFPMLNNYIINPQDTPDKQTVGECSIQCTNCEVSANNCIALPIQGITHKMCSGRNRDANKACICSDGYYDNSFHLTDCIKCSENCLTCKSESICTSCSIADHLELNEYNGRCDCLPGYRIFEEERGCEKCFMLSDVCVQKCPENTLQNEKDSICETLDYQMISNATLILILGIAIGVIQIVLCCCVWNCLQKKQDVMEREILDEKMKIKQQRDHIYKNMDGYSNSNHGGTHFGGDYQKPRPMSSQIRNKNISQQSRLDDSHADQSEMSCNNLQSSNMNLFTTNQNNNINPREEEVGQSELVETNNQNQIKEMDDIHSHIDDSSSRHMDGNSSQGGQKRRRRKQLN